MKQFFFLAFTLLSLASFADTSDYYHVYMRGKKIGNYPQGSIIRVVLQADSLASYDTLKVDVHRDVPCGNCTYSLLIFGSRGPMLIDSTQHTEDFYIPLAPLVAEYRKSGTFTFNGYYTQYYADPSKSKVISFEIKLR